MWFVPPIRQFEWTQRGAQRRREEALLLGRLSTSLPPRFRLTEAEILHCSTDAPFVGKAEIQRLAIRRLARKRKLHYRPFTNIQRAIATVDQGDELWLELSI